MTANKSLASTQTRRDFIMNDEQDNIFLICGSKWKWKHNPTKPLGFESSSMRKMYSSKYLYLKDSEGPQTNDLKIQL